MEKTSLFASRLIDKKEYFTSGHRACVGCGEVVSVRLVGKALGSNTIVSMATGCMEIVSSLYPQTAWEVPWIHTLFENTAAVASGIESGLKILAKKGKYTKKVKVVGMGGDGATADIGMQALSGALERGHDFIYVCYDNEAYMNTGNQRSGTTPYGAATTTSPSGKESIGQFSWKKDMPAIAAAHGVPYVATATPSYPFDLMEKVKKAKETKGPSYIHVLSVCPTGWRSAPELSIKVGRLAVKTGVFPLYEIENGRYTLNVDPVLQPVENYFKLQGRFRHLTPETVKYIQSQVVERYNKIKLLAQGAA
jgi:pyruvate ferredoxin oxidoreductase beta subunit